jgi:hypothetical protein
MKIYTCDCGQAIYFDNVTCVSCKRSIALDIYGDKMNIIESRQNDLARTSDNRQIRLCRNYTEYQVCNCSIPENHDNEYCLSCESNKTIPNLSTGENIIKWALLEKAKRRLIRTLLKLNLPITTWVRDPHSGLAFEFLEEQYDHMNTVSEFVTTGHKDGMITINLDEADDVYRERARASLGELYRTPLGHLRHESGHYYFDRLIQNSDKILTFRSLFGDEQSDYTSSLNKYYEQGVNTNEQSDYISAYAQSHPLEDWAESWAHYLHIMDTLETASVYGITNTKNITLCPENWIEDWTQLTVILNELNRSMGLNDAYPFVLSATVIDKLKFIHTTINSRSL